MKFDDDAMLAHALLRHYGRQREDIQRARLAAEARIRAMVKAGLGEQWLTPMQELSRGIANTEKAVTAQLVALMKRHPLAPFVDGSPGLGPITVGALLGETGPLHHFATTERLWSYLGLSVKDGLAPRRRRGVRSSWSARGRYLCFVLADSIIKTNEGRYRDEYDRKKTEYLARERTGSSECPFGQIHRSGALVIACGDWHPHRAAARYAAKLAVRDLWRTWRKIRREVERW